MRKKILSGILSMMLICAGLAFALAFGFDDLVVSSNDSLAAIHEFEVNEDGQTFGITQFTSEALPIFPDLVSAVGVDGTEGYVLLEDLDGFGPLEEPKNPQEASAYMEQLEVINAEAEKESAIRRAKGITDDNDENYIYFIPLYAEDGTTVIGKFGISSGLPELTK